MRSWWHVTIFWRNFKLFFQVDKFRRAVYMAWLEGYQTARDDEKNHTITWNPYGLK